MTTPQAELPPSERAAFESTMESMWPRWTFEDDGTGGYHDQRTESAWLGWQARAALPQEPAAVLKAPNALEAIQLIADAWNNLDPEHLIAVEYSGLFDRISEAASLKTAEPIGEVVGTHKVGFSEIPLAMWYPKAPPIGTKLYAAPSLKAPQEQINVAAQEHGRMPSASGGTGVGQTDDGALASGPGMRARNAEGSPPAAATPTDAAPAAPSELLGALGRRFHLLHADEVHRWPPLSRADLVMRFNTYEEANAAWLAINQAEQPREALAAPLDAQRELRDFRNLCEQYAGSWMVPGYDGHRVYRLIDAALSPSPSETA